MEEQKSFQYQELFQIALPITVQCIFQSSYNFIDQIMVGQLGTVSIAGSGLSAKFCGLCSVTVSAVAAVASILIAQYYGGDKKKGVNTSFFANLYLALMVVLLFMIPSFLIPETIMGLYTKDINACMAAAGYLRIISLSFLPMTITTLCSALFRTIQESRIPLYGSICSMGLNIIGNYFLIFGIGIFPRLELKGAAIATLSARFVEALLMLFFLVRKNKEKGLSLNPVITWKKEDIKKIFLMVIPILVNEFLWSLGENIYAVIYGRLGTREMAAMTLTGPLQGLFVGLFSGVSSAAIVMVGTRLGKNEYEEAYKTSKILMKIGFWGSVLLGILLSLLAPLYVQIFKVEKEVKEITIYILFAFSAVLFAKVCNMILGGGVIRSGGKTNIILVIDLIGTWVFGVPLGLLTAFVFHLPVYLVYFILSLEEVIRLLISMAIFKKRIWMKNLTE
ncbi:MAG: MATE family efflux transporter [Lachnospiraceae bacterium]|nr:MATE family efflux transporter [Lachnospiraceae bacterium]